MNASAATFVNASPLLRVARLGVCMAAAAVLGGCVGNPFATTAVDPTSPVAAEVTKGARAETDYPSFVEMPPKPNDVRPAKAFGTAAADTAGAGAQLERDTAPGTWTLQPGGTTAFASGAQSAVGREDSATREGKGTDDFARDAQGRATPPPPPR